MEKTRIQAICRLSPLLAIGIAGCRENCGHDDSLPYQADVWAHVRKADGDFGWRRLGSVWNDGWGGESCLDTRPEDPDGSVTALLDAECHKHRMYMGSTAFADYRLTVVLDALAEGWLDNEKKIGQDKTLEFSFREDLPKGRRSQFGILKGRIEA